MRILFRKTAKQTSVSRTKAMLKMWNEWTHWRP